MTAMAGTSEPYHHRLLISSDPSRAWKRYFADLRFEELFPLGEAVGGFGMKVYRISVADQTKPVP
ncbi:MAG: hypothetical protein C4326_07240 [Ignavibacteria bacterium]